MKAISSSGAQPSAAAKAPILGKPVPGTAKVRDWSSNERIEIELLQEAIHRKYGYDFRNYARTSFGRRVRHLLAKSGFDSISAMQHAVLHDATFFESVLLEFSVNVTSMFRDPSFYLALRRDVFPLLREEPFLRIWHAGCASGEEVYSMTILLEEEGLHHRAQLYATDMNELIVHQARQGIYSLDRIQDYAKNYVAAGGKSSFSQYYTSGSSYAAIRSRLKQKVVFADHNLVSDGSFGEMHMIVCRNVMIYFDRELQDHVLSLFRDSLCPGGILCLGSKESVRFSTCANDFADLVPAERIYRRQRDGSVPAR